MLNVGPPGQGCVIPRFVKICDAKTRLSSFVDRAAAGEEMIIAKNGIPCARLVPIVSRGQRRTPANAMQIEHFAADFDEPDPRIERLFLGETV